MHSGIGKNRIFKYWVVKIIILFMIVSCKDESKPINFNTFNAEASSNIPTLGGYDLLDRMVHYNVPGVSIAVVKNGKIIWANGYGLANKEINSKVDSLTLFQAASISKPISALGILLLKETGDVYLNADINTYLKDWKITDTEYTLEETVTVERLLTHTAGVTVHGFPGYSQDEKMPSTLEILLGEGNTGRVEVNSIPGDSWKYSGGGYIILQKIVEDITAMTFEDYMGRHVLKPMGMYSSTFEQSLLPSNLQKASVGYDNKGKAIAGQWNNYPERAAAGLWTTPTDLAKYCIEILEISTGKKKGFLKKETIDIMLTKHKGGWGLGPALSGAGDSLVFGHDGGNKGFRSRLICFPKLGNALIVMTNGDDGVDLINEIQQSIFQAYKW